MTPLSLGLAQGLQKGTCWGESLSLLGPGPPQFSHFQGSDSSLKIKHDPPMVSRTSTLQLGHEVKALQQRQDPRPPPAPPGICISMGSGTLHSFLDPYSPSDPATPAQSSHSLNPVWYPPLRPCPESPAQSRIPPSRSEYPTPPLESLTPDPETHTQGQKTPAHVGPVPGGSPQPARAITSPWRTHPGGAGSAAGSPDAEAPKLWRRPQRE